MRPRQKNPSNAFESRPTNETDRKTKVRIPTRMPCNPLSDWKSMISRLKQKHIKLPIHNVLHHTRVNKPDKTHRPTRFQATVPWIVYWDSCIRNGFDMPNMPSRIYPPIHSYIDTAVDWGSRTLMRMDTKHKWMWVVARITALESRPESWVMACTSIGSIFR
jgi:hypothetical protein